MHLLSSSFGSKGFENPQPPSHLIMTTSEISRSILWRLEPGADRASFGAFEGGSLIGVIGIQREGRKNLRHKALIFGMYVTPAARKKGVGRELLDRTLSHAARMSGLRQVNLCVNAANASAVAMYRAAGFEAFGIERTFLIVNGAPQDLIHMVRVLNGEGGG